MGSTIYADKETLNRPARRGRCSKCNKLGLGQWTDVGRGSTALRTRTCRYCSYTIQMRKNKDMQINRQHGWYWIKGSDGWEPAKWSDRGWEIALSASLAYYTDDDVGEIGSFIPSPSGIEA